MTDLRPDTNPKSAFGMKKPPLYLIPSSALVKVAMVFKLGAQKYGPYNWRETSVAATVYISAAQRHLAAWLDGENDDPESGQPHLAHVVACCLILLDALVCGKLIDDRPIAAPTGQLLRDMIEKHDITKRLNDSLDDFNVLCAQDRSEYEDISRRRHKEFHKQTQSEPVFNAWSGDNNFDDPTGETLVEVKRRNGEINRGKITQFVWLWIDPLLPNDIVGFRLI